MHIHKHKIKFLVDYIFCQWSTTAYRKYLPIMKVTSTCHKERTETLEVKEYLLANVGSTIALSFTAPHPQGYTYYNPLFFLPVGERRYSGASRLIKPTEKSVTASDSA